MQIIPAFPTSSALLGLLFAFGHSHAPPGFVHVPSSLGQTGRLGEVIFQSLWAVGGEPGTL